MATHDNQTDNETFEMDGKTYEILGNHDGLAKVRNVKIDRPNDDIGAFLIPEDDIPEGWE